MVVESFKELFQCYMVDMKDRPTVDEQKSG